MTSRFIAKNGDKKQHEKEEKLKGINTFFPSDENKDESAKWTSKMQPKEGDFSKRVLHSPDSGYSLAAQ